MKRFLVLTVAAALSASSAIAGSLASSAEEADPFVAQDDPKGSGSGIGPLLIGLGAAAVIGGIIVLSGSGSSSAGTTAP